MDEKGTVPKNFELTPEFLNQLEAKVINNTATIEDYETIDLIMFQVYKETDFLLLTMKRNKIFSFEHFITERNKPESSREPLVDSIIMGVLIGLFDVLKGFIKDKY